MEEKPLEFDEYIFENTPQIIQDICNIFKLQHEKEMMLLSTLSVLSGCLPNVFGIYDNRIFYPNIYVFIVAPPSSGKGNIIYAKRLADKIHEQLKEEQSEKHKTLFIPANSSSAFFCQQLADNDEKGILFASEADTLSSSLKQEWGNFSDILRSAFHHEPYSSGRKEGMKTNDLKAPCLASLLSGTPNQVQALISDIENGLLSRFCFYRLRTIYVFKNVFERHKISYDDHFNNLSDKVLKSYNWLSNHSQIEFKLSKKQEIEFLEFYQSKLVIYKNYGDSFIASYNRMALIQFRIAMILTILRELELTEQIEDTIECSNVDFKISTLLIESLLDHSIDIFSEISKLNSRQGKKRSVKELTLNQSLPDEFQRKDGLEIAEKLKISSASFDRYIRDKTFYESTGNGIYRKINAE